MLPGEGEQQIKRAGPGGGDTPTAMVYENDAQRPSQSRYSGGHLPFPSLSPWLYGVTGVYILNISNGCAVPENAWSMLGILFLKIQGSIFYILDFLQIYLHSKALGT